MQLATSENPVRRRFPPPAAEVCSRNSRASEARTSSMIAWPCRVGQPPLQGAQRQAQALGHLVGAGELPPAAQAGGADAARQAVLLLGQALHHALAELRAQAAVIRLALGKGWRSAASKCHSIAPASNSMAPPNTRS
ncbi:MAG: hypothetical protein U1E77_00490 [Inhella sp.]